MLKKFVFLFLTFLIIIECVEKVRFIKFIIKHILHNLFLQRHSTMRGHKLLCFIQNSDYVQNLMCKMTLLNRTHEKFSFNLEAQPNKTVDNLKVNY